MRILLLTSLFDPEHAIKGLSFARGLQQLGHQVEVITTFPNYPGGRIYSGYRMRVRQVEHLEGVRVVRLPTYISHDRSAWRRMLSYASFGFVAGVYATVAARKMDVIYAYHPPIAVGFAALICGCLRRTPFIYDVQDLWPEALVATGTVREGQLTRLVDKLASFIYRRAARVVVLSKGYREALIGKGVGAWKVMQICNWSDENRHPTAEPVERRGAVRGRFEIVYAGNFGKAQALTNVLDAAAALQSRGRDDILFRFVGSGIEEEQLKARADELRLSNVEFVARTAPERVGMILSAADALLVHLADEPVFRITIPSKIQSYLAAGKPVLVAVAGEAADLVTTAKAGEIARPGDAVSIAAAAERLADMSKENLATMAEAGAAFYRNNLSQAAGIAATDRVLRQAVAT